MAVSRVGRSGRAGEGSFINSHIKVEVVWVGY